MEPSFQYDMVLIDLVFSLQLASKQGEFILGHRKSKTTTTMKKQKAFTKERYSSAGKLRSPPI